MGSKKWVDDNHFRETSADGKTSYLYEVSGMWDSKTCIEVADHHSDGTTTPYEYDGGIYASLHSGGRGKPK